MIHFQTRDDIIRWLISNCPRMAIVRSLLQDRSELLGGFSNIPPSGRPGWIVRVTSILTKRKWIVAVIPCHGIPDYEIRILKQVPWKNYVGYEWVLDKSIYAGDRPWLYREMKGKAR